MFTSFAPSSKLAFCLVIAMGAMVGCSNTGTQSAAAVTPLFTQAPAPIAQEVEPQGANTPSQLAALVPVMPSFSWPKAMAGSN